MSLFQIAWRSLAQRRLSSWLTGLSMALGVALVVAVLVVYGVVQTSFQNSARGYHLVVGATKGGRLQLVLNSVFFLSKPLENVRYSVYRDFRDGRYAPLVEAAIPFCLGDSYEGFRVVGTTAELFDRIEYAADTRYEFAQGRNIESDHYFEAVIGSVVAAKTGLKVGDHFQPTHGLSDTEEGHKHDDFEVVGILAPTGTPNDRALFVNIEGFYLLDNHALAEEAATPEGEAAAPTQAGHEGEHEEHGPDGEEMHESSPAGTQAEQEHGQPDHRMDEDHHPEPAAPDHPPGEANHEHEHDHEEGDHEHHEPLPESQREVTAILVLAKSDIIANGLYKAINKGDAAQAAYPASEIEGLFSTFVTPIRWLLLGLAGLVVVIGGMSVMVAMYNSMNERKRDLAVMRALGAKRASIMAIVLLESVLLAVCGGAAGLILGHGLIAVLNPWLVAETGVSIPLFRVTIAEAAVIPGMILLAAVVGGFPAITAYRTDVGRVLSSST
jgi:putative ABC transport system permease protein